MANGEEIVLHLKIVPDAQSTGEIKNSIQDIVDEAEKTKVPIHIDDKEALSKLKAIKAQIDALNKGADIPLSFSGTALKDLGKISDALDKIRKQSTGIGDAISKAFADASASVGKAFSGAEAGVPGGLTGMSDEVQHIKDQLSGMFDGVKDIDANSVVSNIVQELTSATTMLQQRIDEAISAFAKLNSSTSTQGVSDGLADMANKATNDLQNAKAEVESLQGSIVELKGNLSSTDFTNGIGALSPELGKQMTTLVQQYEQQKVRIQEIVREITESISRLMGGNQQTPNTTPLDEIAKSTSSIDPNSVNVLDEINNKLLELRNQLQLMAAGGNATIDTSFMTGFVTAIDEAVRALGRLSGAALAFSRIEFKVNTASLDAAVQQVANIFKTLTQSGEASGNASAQLNEMQGALHNAGQEATTAGAAFDSMNASMSNTSSSSASGAAKPLDEISSSAKDAQSSVDSMNESLQRTNTDIIKDALSGIKGVNDDTITNVVNTVEQLGFKLTSAKAQAELFGKAVSDSFVLMVSGANEAGEAIERYIAFGTNNGKQLTTFSDADFERAKDRYEIAEVDNLNLSGARQEIDATAESASKLVSIVDIADRGLANAGREAQRAFYTVQSKYDKLAIKEILEQGNPSQQYADLLKSAMKQYDVVRTDIEHMFDEVEDLNGEKQSVLTVEYLDDLREGIALLDKYVEKVAQFNDVKKMAAAPDTETQNNQGLRDLAVQLKDVQAIYNNLNKQQVNLASYFGIDSEQMSALNQKITQLNQLKAQMDAQPSRAGDLLPQFKTLAQEIDGIISKLNEAKTAQENFSKSLSNIASNTAKEISSIVSGTNKIAQYNMKSNGSNEYYTDDMAKAAKETNTAATALKNLANEQKNVSSSSADMQSNISKQAEIVGKLRNSFSEYVNAARSAGNTNDEFDTQVRHVMNAFDDYINALNGGGDASKTQAENIQICGNALSGAFANLQNVIKAEHQAEQAARETANATRDAANASNERTKLMQRIDSILNSSTKAKFSNNDSSRQAYEAISGMVDKVKELDAQYKNGDMTLTQYRNSLSNLSKELSTNYNTIVQNGDAVKTLGQRFASVVKYFSTWFTGTRMILTAVRNIKKMISTSIELDDVMTQMQIVTHANEKSMSDFADAATDAATRVGSSITDFVSSATVFARLGYDMDESNKLAEYVAMLQNVGDIDASEAQDAITSIIKAFDIDVDEIESVMDKLVKTGGVRPIIQ